MEILQNRQEYEDRKALIETLKKEMGQLIEKDLNLINSLLAQVVESQLEKWKEELLLFDKEEEFRKKVIENLGKSFPWISDILSNLPEPMAIFDGPHFVSLTWSSKRYHIEIDCHVCGVTGLCRMFEYFFRDKKKDKSRLWACPNSYEEFSWELENSIKEGLSLFLKQK